jgi:hypothetical protein
LQNSINPKPGKPEDLEQNAGEPEKGSKPAPEFETPEKWLSSLDELFLFDPNFESCW